MPKRRTTPRQPHEWYSLAVWTKRRCWQLANEPLCRVCAKAGRVEVATEADHIVPCGSDWVEFRLGELQSLCRPCHQAKTQRERGYRPRPWIALDGTPHWLPLTDAADVDAQDEDVD
jgi:5-methylcytosine-specific restriction endonuclease McrA